MQTELQIQYSPSCGDPDNDGFNPLYAAPYKIKEYRLMAELDRDEAAALIGATGRAWKSWETGARNMSVADMDRWKELYRKATLMPGYKLPSEVAAEKLGAKMGAKTQKQMLKKKDGWRPGQALPLFVPKPLTPFELEVEKHELKYGMGTHPSSITTPQELAQLQKDFDEALEGQKKADIARAEFLKD